jgi:hypothetical protein
MKKNRKSKSLTSIIDELYQTAKAEPDPTVKKELWYLWKLAKDAEAELEAMVEQVEKYGIESLPEDVRAWLADIGRRVESPGDSWVNGLPQDDNDDEDEDEQDED